MKEESPSETYRLELRGISKFFPGVKALDQVELPIISGEVHALCGENGAGKSTLMNILSGNHQPDEGTIFLNGRAIQIPDQKAAQEYGIAIVYQERSLVNSLNVAENIFPNNQPLNRFGLIDYPKLYQKTQDLLRKLRLGHISPKTLIAHLPPAQQQMVEIAKALARDPDILILDEPTATISEVEVDTLFEIIRELKARKVSVIYISHRLAEIFEIADRVSVLKDGQYQGTTSTSKIDVHELIRMMVGRDLEEIDPVSQVQEEVVFELIGLSGNGFRDISFQLKKGEILALAGLVGAGRSEVARAIIGADPYQAGEIRLHGQLQYLKHPRQALDQRIAYLPEHRKELGLFPEMPLEDNIAVSKLSSVASQGLIRRKKMQKIAKHYVQQLNIKTPSTQQKVLYLSGGNQQKVVLAKCLLPDPDILIVDEPTQGIDVGAKAEIYKLLFALARQGKAILLISSELPEVLTLSDRILIMHQGRITGELSRAEATENEIMHYASNTKNMFLE